MFAYVINLENRKDRWKSVLSQADELQVPLIRVEAVSMSTLNGKPLFVAPGVAATWNSHPLAMETFLASGEEYGIILEDDFLITRKWNLKRIEVALRLNPDFFQFGYLITSPIDRVNLFLNNQLDCLLKILVRFHKYIPKFGVRIGSKLLVSEQRGLQWDIVPNNIRAGGQAYLVSRKFAQASQFMNSPAFTSADGMFMALGDVRSFRMFRHRKSLINQTNSPTSVHQRYL
jgi:GR25 family glycosyltransferase involved in LPS biosynthesis